MKAEHKPMRIDDLMNEQAVMDFLGVSAMSLGILRKKGLPHYAVSKVVRVYSLRDLIEWLQDRKVMGGRRDSEVDA
jgi:hypothetical protein